MKPTQRSLLLHPIFLSSVILLLVNDHYWKYEYHNTVTGKLSDIAGLVILPVFLSLLFPKYRLHTFIFSALFFIVWKSPWSQPVIDAINDNTGWNIGRVVDPTDLLALLVLPLAWKIKPKESGSHSMPLFRNVAIALSAVFTVTSLCATTCCYRYLQVDQPIHTSGHFRTMAYVDDIINTFKEHNIDIRRDTVHYAPVTNSDLYTQAKDSSGKSYMTRAGNIYRRDVPVLPTFTIPELVIGNDTLHDIRFRIETTSRKFRLVQLESFKYRGIVDLRVRGNDDKYLERQFRKPILNTLKKVLK